MPMPSEKRLPLVLLLLRISIFVVMLVWTLDKFVRPEHAASVYAHFYFIGGLSRAAPSAIGVLELALLVAFVLGIGKRVTYGAILVLHGISTLSSFRQYAAPFQGSNLLFFAAWPMLAACLGLYVLRDLDTLGTMRWTSRRVVKGPSSQPPLRAR